MIPTGYTVLQVSKDQGAAVLLSEGYYHPTGATGAGGYLAASGAANGWNSVSFLNLVWADPNAPRVGGGPFPESITLTGQVNGAVSGLSVVIGGTTPNGDLRLEPTGWADFGNIAEETSATGISGYEFLKGVTYSGACYAVYEGAGQSWTGKVGIGTSAADIATSGYYEGSFTTHEIFEFDPEYQVDTGDLLAIETGSGVYLEENLDITFGITDPFGQELENAAEIAANPFVSGQRISLLDANGNMVFPNWRNYGDSQLSIGKRDRDDAGLGQNFGALFETVSYDGKINRNEYNWKANKLQAPHTVYVTSSGGVKKNQAVESPNAVYPTGKTGDIANLADRKEALRYTNNQPVLDSLGKELTGSSGYIEFGLAFDNDPTYTRYGNITLAAGPEEDFKIDEGSIVLEIPLEQSREQIIRLGAGDGIPADTGQYYKMLVDNPFGPAPVFINCGFAVLEELPRPQELFLPAWGNADLDGNIVVKGENAGYITGNCLTIGPPSYDHPYTINTKDGHVGIGTSTSLQAGAKLSVYGRAIGTGDGGRLTGPSDLPYLLSGDAAGTESDTLQTVADRGNTTTTDIGIGISTTPTNKLDVAGAVAIGNTYAGSASAPSNGLLVEGTVGIGSSVGIGFSTSPNAQLHVSASAGAPTFRLSRAATAQIWEQTVDSSNRWHLREAASEGGTQYTRLQIDDDGETLIAPNGGNVGIGFSTSPPSNQLDVAGRVGIGSSYAGATSAPSNGLLVEGNVGIGITEVTAQKLYVKGASAEVELATDDGYSIKSSQKAVIAGVGIGSTSINSTGSMIAGGSGHHISGDYDTIAGGTLNNISGGDFNFIGGGSQIDLTGSAYSSSIGGKNNDIFYSDYAIIGGGRNNKIESATVAFIGGGSSNEIHDGVSAIAGGVSNLISGGNGYSFVGGGEENMVYGTFSSILGGEGNKVYGNDAVTLGGWFSESTGKFALVGPGRASKVSGDYAVGLGNKVEIPIAHTGATVLADGQDRIHASSGMHTATLDFASGVYVPTIGYFGQGLHVSGVPVLTGENNPAEADTLQTVTTRGNETTTSIISTGPYISGVTGYYKDTLRVGDGGFVDFPSEYDTLQVGTSSSATNGHILVRGKESSITFRGVEGSDKAHTIKEDAGTLTFYGDSTLSGTAGNARFAIQTGQSYFTDLAGVQANGKKPQFYLASIGGGASNKATHFYQPANSADFRIALNGSQHNGTIGTDAFAIKSTYEVGVGTVDPRAALHVDNGAGATTGFLVENSSNKNILWAEDNESINARSTFNVYHTTVASRYLQLGWGSIFANDNGNELTLGSNYSSNSATRIFVGAEGATNVPANTIQMQANHGLAVFSGVSTDTFDPTALLDVRGDAYISGDVLGTGVGNRITNNGTPYLLSGDSPAETQTLQDVCDNGSTTTTSVTIGDDLAVDTDTLFVDASTDRVGINRNSLTTYDLEVRNGAGGSSSLGIIGGSASSLVLNTTDTSIVTVPAAQMFLRATGGFYFQSGTTTKAVLTKEGDFGIGTASPQAQLQVNTPNHNTFALGIGNDSYVGGNPRHELLMLNDGSLSWYLPDNGSTPAKFQFYSRDNSDFFFTADSDTSRVGIGTVSPARKLDVSTNSSDTYGIRNSYNASYYMEMAHNRFNAVGNNYIRFNIDDATKMTIVDSDFGGGVNGVGIGITNPTTELQVIGDISGSGSFLGTGVGNRITNNHIPYLLSGDEAGATNTLQDVCDNGNTTTTTIESTKEAGTAFSATSGTDRYFVVDASGRIGLNAGFSPTHSIEIDNWGNKRPANIWLNSSTLHDASIEFSHNGAYGFIMGSDETDRKFKISSGNALGTNDRLVIDTAGNVGIGTDAPASTAGSDRFLEVYGPVDAGLVISSNNGEWDIKNTNPTANLSFLAGGSHKVTFTTAGLVGIGTQTPANKLDVAGSVAIGSSYVGTAAPSNGAIIQGNVGIGTTSASNALDVNGHLSATSKSFLIDHPIEENKKLQYACLEGPENGVYVRGTTNSTSIELPDYWSELIHEDSITVIVTPIGKKQDLYIKSKSPQLIMIGGVKGSYDYVVYGERKDIDRLEIEPLKV